MYRFVGRNRGVCGIFDNGGDVKSVENQQSLFNEPEESARTSRMRRVIFMLSSDQFSQIEGLALLGGYVSIEEYAKAALKERFESDQERCRAAMGSTESAGGREARKRKA